MDDAQLLRYSRHILLPELGMEAQTQWLQSHALIVGAGGLGCAAGLYLAAAGIGQLSVWDHDSVDLTNLQRQIAHSHQDIDQPKAQSLAARMRAINPTISVQASVQRATLPLLLAALPEVDVVLDCTDNFTTRHLINAACVQTGTRLVSASALGFSGQLAVFDPREPGNACYACIYPEHAPPPEQNCSSSGVLGPLVGVMGSMQAAQTLLALSAPPVAGTRLQLLDIRTGEMQTIRVPRSPHCSVCGARHASEVHP